MVRLAADENFDNRILRGLLMLKPDLDVIRIQDSRIAGAGDPTVLEFTASERRVLLTHDLATMPHFVYERLAAGSEMSGVLIVNRATAIGLAIEDVLLVLECTADEEWEGLIRYVPL